MKVLFEVRKLNIGDFAWIARCRITNRELVLPYIIERKRMDDLSSSIMDGRYREQKVPIMYNLLLFLLRPRTQRVPKPQISCVLGKNVQYAFYIFIIFY